MCRVLHPQTHPAVDASDPNRPANKLNVGCPQKTRAGKVTFSCFSKQPRHRNNSMEKITEMPAMQACDERSTYAILDTGASRCIIGSHVLSKLLQRLPASVQKSLKERPSQIKFRFGNNQTLTSQKKVLFPFWSQSHERVWLGVEVVEGSTPFLFSKRAFKQLGGILDTTKDRCTLSRLQKEPSSLTQMPQVCTSWTCRSFVKNIQMQHACQKVL